MTGLLALLLLCVSACAGTLGLTEAEAREKYGKPVVVIAAGQAEAPAELALTFEKDGIYIVTEFYQGRVARVVYVRKDRRAFAEHEVQILLRNQMPAWTPTREGWSSPDGRFIAVHWPASQLSICLRSFVQMRLHLDRQSLRGL